MERVLSIGQVVYQVPIFMNSFQPFINTVILKLTPQLILFISFHFISFHFISFSRGEGLRDTERESQSGSMLSTELSVGLDPMTLGL